jgi:Spy/CpxP family protein refolding chaperone
VAKSDLIAKKPKNNSNKKGIPDQLKAARRAEAEARNAEYAKLTPEQKLARLDAGGFRAEKQRTQLICQIVPGDKK